MLRQVEAAIAVPEAHVERRAGLEAMLELDLEAEEVDIEAASAPLVEAAQDRGRNSQHHQASELISTPGRGQGPERGSATSAGSRRRRSPPKGTRPASPRGSLPARPRVPHRRGPPPESRAADAESQGPRALLDLEHFEVIARLD